VPPIRIDADYFSSDIRSFIRILGTHQIQYMIVGGQAVILHGHVRLTGDVDFFYAADEENVARLFVALQEFWEGNVPGLTDPAELLTPGVIVQFGVPPNRIDLISSIEGVSFADAWPGRLEAVVESPEGDLPVPFIGIEALVQNKRAAARPKDLDDLSYLIRKL